MKEAFGMKDIVIKNGLCLFWGDWPSNWTSSTMIIDNVKYNCVEQYMMSMKARLFGDREALKLIMNSDNPKEQKRIGRSVVGFETDRWFEIAYEIVLRSTVEKYRQNPKLLILLQSMGDVEFVEASPQDVIWGIGLGPNNPDSSDKSKWRGQNLLGKAITTAKMLINEFERDGISIGGGINKMWSKDLVNKLLIGVEEVE
jgi:ribA/ribD-fused uncharacterized protein